MILRYLKKFHLPENPEILFMLILGILLQMTDGSPFSMKYRWSLVWDIELPAEYFSLLAQKIIKIILTIIIMVRCSTTYAYVISAMLVIFCLIKKSIPKLMLLWLLVAGVKSIFMTFVEAIAGVYVCSAFGKIRKACVEFFISKALEIIFAAYLWGNVLSIYQDMETKAKNEANVSTKDVLFKNIARHRARSLLDESTLYKTACLNNFEFKDVPQIILQMLRRDDEMSEDSLLGPGMMLASVSNLGSFDNLKTSQSLGELGFMDLGTTQVIGLEDDEDLSHREKVLKFLKLTRSDVAKIKLNKSSVENDIFTVEDDIWARVIASGTHINKPKQARTEVFIREISQLEETVTKTENQRKGTVKFDITFSNLLMGKKDDQEEEDSLIFSQDEEEGKEDEETIRLFMSNIKEGTVINRHGLGFGLKMTKGNRYEKLYKQDFMSTIGPEVFERATNLPKVTSFTKLMRNSVSLPEISQTSKKINIPSENSARKIDQTSSLDFSKKESLLRESVSEVEVGNISERTSTADESSKNSSFQMEYEEAENESIIQSEDEEIPKKSSRTSKNFEFSNLNNNISLPSLNISGEMKPCFRKRRIVIRRRGNCCSAINTNTSSNQLSGPDVEFMTEDGEKSEKLKNNSQNGYSDVQKICPHLKKNQIYFLTEILEKPIWKVSITYYDLNENMSLQEKCEIWSQRALKEEKTWKSDVLRTVEMNFMPKYSQTFGPSWKNLSFLSRTETTNTKCLKFISKDEREDFMKLYEDDVKLTTERETRKIESRTSNDFTLQQDEEPSIFSVLENINVQSSREDDGKNEQQYPFEEDSNESEIEKVCKSLAEEDSFSSQESDEPISLYYSKAADLSSPLLDMRRFIYPDHIHYSYKHVNKKGFDVDINGGFPLLVGENLPMSSPLNLVNESKLRNREPVIKSRPMDLSFATSNFFADWQNNYSNDIETKQVQTAKNKITTTKDSDSFDIDFNKYIKAKKIKYLKKLSEKKENRVSNGCIKSKAKSKKFEDIKFMYSAKDYVLIEKLLRMHVQFNKNEYFDSDSKGKEREPTQISSTQLHSNKGRKNSIKNPAIFLQKNKSRCEKKKIDTQEERTKDMFARLASEAFLQSSGVYISSGSKRNL